MSARTGNSRQIGSPTTSLVLRGLGTDWADAVATASDTIAINTTKRLLTMLNEASEKMSFRAHPYTWRATRRQSEYRGGDKDDPKTFALSIGLQADRAFRN